VRARTNLELPEEQRANCQHADMNRSVLVQATARFQGCKVRNERVDLEKRTIHFLVKADYEKERRRRFRKVGRKIANVRFHGRMPKALEAKKIHFLQGALR